MKFDGKRVAREIESELIERVVKLLVKPKIVSILVGNDPASELYTRLKQEAARRVGIIFEVVRYDAPISLVKLKSELNSIAKKADVTGLMIQLPIPGYSSFLTQKALSVIPSCLDVDGLIWQDSQIMPATVRAILLILDKIGSYLDKKIVVIGSRGIVGRPLVQSLVKKRIDVVEVEWDTKDWSEKVKSGQIIVSCVGKLGLINESMVSEKAIVIDVGGDMTKEVYQKASISLEVPGGVGPVTIACLLLNALEIVEAKHT